MEGKNQMTAIEVVEKIQKQADESSNGVRFVTELAIGEAARQGDVYIIRVEDNYPRGEMLSHSQLAQGNTIGSRHLAMHPAKCFQGTTLPPNVTAGTFLGPVVVSQQRFEVNHPEHSTISLPAGTYQSLNQMDAATLDRVRD